MSAVAERVALGQALRPPPTARPGRARSRGCGQHRPGFSMFDHVGDAARARRDHGDAGVHHPAFRRRERGLCPDTDAKENAS